LRLAWLAEAYLQLHRLDEEEDPALVSSLLDMPFWFSAAETSANALTVTPWRYQGRLPAPRRSWLRGSDLNRRPLGYEASTCRNVPQRSPMIAVIQLFPRDLAFGSYWDSLAPVHGQNTAEQLLRLFTTASGVIRPSELRGRVPCWTKALLPRRRHHKTFVPSDPRLRYLKEDQGDHLFAASRSSARATAS